MTLNKGLWTHNREILNAQPYRKTIYAIHRSEESINEQEKSDVHALTVKYDGPSL